MSSPPKDGAGDDLYLSYIQRLLVKGQQDNNKPSYMGLQTCTEGIGSESGYDSGFSSYAPPHVRYYPVEYDDDREENGAPDHQLLAKMANFRNGSGDGNRRSNDREKESVARPAFPPPISTLARGGHRPGEITRRSFQMRRYRNDGRLVVEVVPAQNDNSYRARDHEE